MQFVIRLALASLLLTTSIAFAADESNASSDQNLRASHILKTLPGRWTFALGERTSGRRAIETLYPDMVLKWSETFDGRDVVGDGFLGWNSESGEFFSMAVHNRAGEYGHMTGRLADSGHVIEWTPAAPKPGRKPFKSVFELVNENQFTSTALVQSEDGQWETSWVARFTREVAGTTPPE